MSTDPSEEPAHPRERVAKILQHALDEEMALSATMRAVLGRMPGASFHSLHRLLADQSQQIDQWQNEIAERVRAFGRGARSRPENVAPDARLIARASDADAATPRGVIDDVVALHERVAQRLREDAARCVGDTRTASLLTRLVEFHDTTAWMLRLVQGRAEVPDSPA